MSFDRIKELLFGNEDLSGKNLLREAKALAGAIPLIAQILVDDLGNKISVRRQVGPGACTDGKTIWLMDTPVPSTTKDVKNFVLFVALKLGLIHHEAGHVNETDFTVARSRDSLVHHLENLIEDIRQELVHISRVKSARAYLDALGMAELEIGLNPPLDDTASEIDAFTAYLYYRLRVEYRDEHHYTERALQAQRVIEAKLSPGLIVRLDAILPRVESLTSTVDAMHLAEDLRAFLEQEMKQAQQQAQQQASSGQSGGNAPASNGAQSNPGNSAGGAADNGSSQASGSGNGAGASSADAGDPDAGNNGNSQQQLADALADLLAGKNATNAIGDRDKALHDALEQLSGQLKSSKGVRVVPDYPSSVQAGDSTLSTASVINGLPVDLDEAMGVVGRLRGKLKQELQTQSTARVGRSDHGSRLDRKALVRVPLGDARIFRKTQDAILVDTAVLLLGDVSGSMGGEPILLADQAIFATACAIENLPGCSVAVAAFPGHQVVLPFGARASKNRQRFTLSAHGGTPMHEGITMATRMLSRRKEPRKLMFVVTDGQPDDQLTAEMALLAAQRMKVECYGIGIRTAVQHLFPVSETIHSVQELPAVLINMLRGRLVQRQAA